MRSSLDKVRQRRAQAFFVASVAAWTMAIAIAPGAAAMDVDAASRTAAADDALQAWLRQHAVPVRSLDAADEDFADLEPLVDAIGGARVVQLGEPSHGAGASFAAKVRLVKFLHQRMGFDVVAWESGLYDVHLTQAALRGGGDAVAAAQAGILMIWSASAEVRPLFEYARASQATGRPLDMAGFDSTMNAAYASDRFATDLRAFVGVLRDAALRRRATGLVEEIVAAHAHLFARSEAMRRIELASVQAAMTGKAPTQSRAEAVAVFEASEAAKRGGRKQDIEVLERAAGELLTTIDRQRPAFLQVHAARHVSFMARAVDNLRGNDRKLYERERPDRPAAGSAAAKTRFNEEWNDRDARNVRNLRWLVEEGYPGRKIIVWAHNVHLMNAHYSAGVDRIRIEPQAGGLVPSGVALADWLGDAVYTIAMTSYAGEDGWNSTKPVAPAPEGSLEWRLHRLGKPYVFVDLRALDGDRGHPLRQPQSLRIDKYRDDPLTDVTRAFDALLFLDRMTPATRIAATGEAAR